MGGLRHRVQDLQKVQYREQQQRQEEIQVLRVPLHHSQLRTKITHSKP